MPLFHHVGGSVLTERGAIVTIEEVSALALEWKGKAWAHQMLNQPTLERIYDDLSANAQEVMKEAVDWNRAAAGAPL